MKVEKHYLKPNKVYKDIPYIHFIFDPYHVFGGKGYA